MTEPTWGLWGVASVVVAIAGVVRGFSGFGAGLVMVPALSLILGPAAAVPLIVLLEAIAAAQLVPSAVARARWRAIAPLAIAATLAIPLGGTVLARVDPVLLRRGISAVVLVFVAVLWTGWRYRRTPTWPVATATGATSGLLTGAAGVGGPPVILFFLSGPHDAPSTRSSLIVYFAVTQWVALATFAIYGLLGRTTLTRALFLAPIFMIAAWFGTRLFGKVDEARFRRATMIFLILVSIVGVLRGAPGG